MGEFRWSWKALGFGIICRSVWIKAIEGQRSSRKKKWTKQGTLLVHVHRLDSGIKPRPGLGRINPQNKSRIPKKGQKKGVWRDRVVFQVANSTENQAE